MVKHGAPDWYKYRRESTTFPIGDLAELAARLNSIVTFDRRGDVFWMEDFSAGLQRWTTGGAGTGLSVSISPASYRSAGYSAKLIPGSDGARNAQIYTRFPYPHLAKTGLEVAFTIGDQHEYFYLRTTIYTGALYMLAEIKYDVTTGILSYRDSTFTYVALNPPLVLYASTALFHHLKLVVDALNYEYVRVTLDNEAHDMANIATYTHASTQNPHILVNIYYKAVAGNNPTAYVDDIIVTQDEP